MTSTTAGTFNFYDGKITSAGGTGTAIHMGYGSVVTPDNYDVATSTTNGVETATLVSQNNSGILFPWEMIPVTVTNLTSASGNSPVSWRTIPTGEESVYQAQESIVLKDGFLVERGADEIVFVFFD